MKLTVDFVKKNKNIIVYYGIFLVSLIFLYKQLIDGTNNNGKVKLIFLIIALLSFSVLIFLNKIVNSKKYEIHKLFFIISLFFGLLYLVFIPAICGTDELPHFLRAYQISAGDLIVKDNNIDTTKIPENLLAFTQWGLPLEQRYSKDNIFKSVDYNNMSVIYHGDVASGYPPVAYVPQVIGLKVSKLVKLSPALTLYVVRFFNFMSWILLMTLAIKNFPIHKKTLAVFFTAPATLSLVSTSNMDAFSLGLIVLLLSYIFKYKYDKSKISKKDKTIIALISLLFCTYKLFYIILLSFLFFIPTKCFKNIKDKYLFIISLLLMCLSIDYIWYIISNNTPSITGESLGAKQTSFIMKYPIYYIHVLFNTYVSDFYYYFSNLFGGHEMCYMKANLNDFFVIIYIVLFGYILINSENKNIKMTLIEKLYVILISIIIIILVSTSMYISWTVDYAGIGSNTILGIQSRYYFALIPPLIMLIKNRDRIINEKVYNYILLINSILFINTISSILINLV